MQLIEASNRQIWYKYLKFYSMRQFFVTFFISFPKKAAKYKSPIPIAKGFDPMSVWHIIVNGCPNVLYIEIRDTVYFMYIIVITAVLLHWADLDFCNIEKIAGNFK